MSNVVNINPPSDDDLHENTCEHCAFSRFKDGPAGECRINPPVPLIVPGQHPISRQIVPMVQAAFPPVERRTWCYAFESREDEHGTHAGDIPA